MNGPGCEVAGGPVELGGLQPIGPSALLFSNLVDLLMNGPGNIVVPGGPYSIAWPGCDGTGDLVGLMDLLPEQTRTT